MENKKFEMTSETVCVHEKTLHRIRALKSFKNVSAGDLGGFIEKEENLSHDGDAWVGGNAYVYDDAQVYGNAQVYGDAQVCGNAEVCGNAKVRDNTDYATVKGFGTVFRNTTFFRCKDKKICVSCGCFYGTINQFREQVKRTRKGKIAKEYLMIADLMEMHFGKEV